MMLEAFEAFFNRPTADNYRTARNYLLADPDFQPHFGELARLLELHRAGCYEELRRRIEEMMPQWALCPRIHWLGAISAERLGDAEDAELEAFTATVCLEGILATGIGTARRPYLVTYGGDQYDVLEMLGLAAESQTLVQKRGRQLDRIDCQDGSSVWFDVTSLFRHSTALAEPLLAAPAARQ